MTGVQTCALPICFSVRVDPHEVQATLAVPVIETSSSNVCPQALQAYSYIGMAQG